MGIFTTIDSGVPSVFPQRPHPLAPLDSPGNQPVQTNKFYGNLLLGNRTLTCFPHPYTVWWTGVANFYGLGLNHVTAAQRQFGPDPSANPVEYYYNPVMIMSLCLSADEFSTTQPNVSTESWGPMSVTARLTSATSSGYAKFPIVNGMGFVTGVYYGLRPMVASQIGFKTVGAAQNVTRMLTKLKVVLQNDVTWLIYVTSAAGHNVGFTQSDPNHILVNSTEAPLTLQVAVLANPAMEEVYDKTAGAYAVEVQLEGGVTQDYQYATYAFNYGLQGVSNGGTAVWALPHHVESFTSRMNGRVTDFKIDSTVLGQMTLCVTDTLEMYEQLPTDVGFLPWAMNKPEGDANFAYGNFSATDKELLSNTVRDEANSINISQATNLTSMYFSGKALDKYAMILLVAHFILKDDGQARALLANLQAAFATFTSNKQTTPLFYDTAWKGLCSQAGIADSGADFGNTYYNDHHFHYGYFIHAAAVIGRVDADLGGSWAQDNKQWVNALVRDVANYGNDPAFPMSRSFDWFQGHSLAKGLFASGDGKDEESSSEDYHCYYGIKLWGNVIGDRNMEARSNLILAVERRAMNHYMLYSDDNTTEPVNIIKNKVSGIKFENKIDHTTYFGTNIEYIQGIHMIPITPISSYIRGPTFVQQEWEQIIAGIVNNVDSGWKGILQLNRALYDASSAYAFFSDPGFQIKWLDDGLSRSWALAFTRALT